MHKIYSFNYEKILDKELEVIHFNYYLNKDTDNQKVFLEKSGIARSSFLLAKKEGFINSDKLNNKIKEYYNIKPYNKDLYISIKELIEDSYTEVHYDSTGVINNYYDKLFSYYEQVKDTQLEILVLIGMCMTIEISKHKVDISSWENKIDMLDEVYPLLDTSEKYLILYSLSTFYTNKSDNASIIKYCNEIDKIMGLPDPLCLLASFCLMTGARLQGNNLIAMKHLNKASELCNIYYSEYLNQSIRSLRSVLYLALQEYDMCLTYTLADILRIQREDKFALGYISSLHNITHCYIKLNNFKEAIKYSLLCAEYNIVDNKFIPQVYHSILEIKRQLGFINLLYSYYKMQDYSLVEEYYNKIEVSNEIKLLAKAILLLSKKDMKPFLSLLVEIKSLNNKFYFGWLESFEEEYKKYLVDNNKYVSIYDMKV